MACEYGPWISIMRSRNVNRVPCNVIMGAWKVIMGPWKVIMGPWNLIRGPGM